MRQSFYSGKLFLITAFLLVVCISMLVYFVSISHSNIEYLHRITDQSTPFYIWRFSVYSGLLIIWPQIIKRISRQNQSHFQYSRRYLLVMMLSYELIIVLNPLKDVLNALTHGGA